MKGDVVRTPLENILLIANPASQNGNGGRLAEEAMETLFRRMTDASIEVILTTHPHHATELAADAAAFDTVIALGGDGLVHETVNGLMQLPKELRPQLGVIPTGSGNDFAKSLGMPKGVKRACKAICTASSLPTDIGQVNGHWFMETLSFGLDAAIALDTVERRVRTGQKGTLLYGASAAHQLKNSFTAYRYTLCLDDGEPLHGESITFAVQNGPYYGSGFKICPDAKLDDGLFNLCISHPPISRTKASFAFLRAKAGRHTSMRELSFHTASKLVLDFDDAPFAQMDGEAIGGTHFEARMDHSALHVLFPLHSSRQKEGARMREPLSGREDQN